MAPVNNELCAIEVSGRSSSFALFPVARRGSLSRKSAKKLLCPLVNAQRSKVSFLCGVLDRVYDLICQLNLRFESSTVVLYILKALLHHVGQILRQHLGCLCRVDGRSGLAGPPESPKGSLLSALLMTCSYSPGWSMAALPYNFLLL